MTEAYRFFSDTGQANFTRWLEQMKIAYTELDYVVSPDLDSVDIARMAHVHGGSIEVDDEGSGLGTSGLDGVGMDDVEAFTLRAHSPNPTVQQQIGFITTTIRTPVQPTSTGLEDSRQGSNVNVNAISGAVSISRARKTGDGAFSPGAHVDPGDRAVPEGGLRLEDGRDPPLEHGLRKAAGAIKHVQRRTSRFSRGGECSIVDARAGVERPTARPVRMRHVPSIAGGRGTLK